MTGVTKLYVAHNTTVAGAASILMEGTVRPEGEHACSFLRDVARVQELRRLALTFFKHECLHLPKADINWSQGLWHLVLLFHF